MDGFLRALFLSKGFQEEQLDTIEAKDKDLRSVNDLAAGATSEDDARAWSEELGLSGRVQKSRFVQAWAEARTQGNIGRPAQSSAPAANGYVDVAPASRNATPVEPPPAPVDPPRAVERYVEEEDTQEDWSWVKVSRPVETRVALSYIDGEPVSRPGGVSDLLRSSFRTHGLTSIEVAQLEQMLEARSRTALAVAAATPEGAMRLARSCGVHSKVSQENFAKAWHEAAAAMVALAPGPAPTEKRSLSELSKEKDFEACTKALMKKANVARPKDLLPLLRGMLEHLAVQEQLVSSETKQAKSKSKVLPALASLYGAEAEAAAEKKTELTKAEWRYNWQLRMLFTAKIALAIQSEILAAYQEPSFQVACEEVNASWESRDSKMSLEQKMQSIEALCQERALNRILPKYGFRADAAGISQMKEAVGRFSKEDPEVRRKQMEITSAVMKKFKL